jgi:serine phosphatase RsbU (regulator of sigma subunit)
MEVVPDPYSHPEFDCQFDKKVGFRTRNILCAPLLSWGKEEKLLGVLQVLNKHDRPFDELDQRLLRAFAAHAAIAIDRAILAKHYAEKMQLLVSLNLARQVQAGLLPRRLPEIPGYEIAGVSRPADQTGGDYYDAISLDSGQLGLVVADVSGHGFGPSLLMATARAMLRGIARKEHAAEEVLNELSRAIFDDLQHVRRFITLLYGTLDPRGHSFRYANAGHGPLGLHLDSENKVFRSLVDDESRGYPLGWFEHAYLACEPARLGPGDVIVLGTDGIVESRRGGEQFGMERLRNLILERRQSPLPELIQELVERSVDFHEEESFHDDLTLIIVRRT